MGRAVVCLLLWGCGPVLLGEETGVQQGGTNGAAGAQDGVAGTDSVSSAGVGSSVQEPGREPAVSVRIRPLDCGKCFALRAEGSGGLPPYEFEWEDGSLAEERNVCVEDTALVLSVMALDAANSRSPTQTIHLDAAGDASCPEPAVEPADAGPVARLCLENPSFEGTPAPDFFGLEQAFDAAPWNACTNPARTNVPRLGNDTVSLSGSVPPPRDGETYLGLGEGDQVSQELCSELPGGVPLYLELDLARIDLGGVPQTEQVFLEIYGGLSVDCSQREMLWASPGLPAEWQHFCVTLRPTSFTTQLTLRGNADMTLASPAYLLVDNLQPVDSCP